jgi:tetratricopeptide (TPR) repeat protein
LETELRVSRARAYERLAAKYPEDYEARIFSGLYIAASQNLSDQNFNELRKASAILEPFFTKFPEHPGVAHYLIHSHDTPTLAKDGLKAARRYADIAPAAPHALHMPSHLFTRVGAWEESAAANRRATIAARQGNEPGEALHTVDYTVYAYLQLARDSDARAVFAEAQQVRGFDPNGSIGPYPLAIDPARIAVERGAWKEAAQLQAAPASVQYAPANTHFARALGAARSGYPDAAKKDLERITALRDELVTAKNVYWANEVEVMRLSSAAWIALAENRNDEALSLMRQAADSEDGREKNSLTPARLLPARELLGDMLLQLHRPAEALVAYEASQLREPNRFRGLNGAATAAAQSGNVVKARLYFRQLVELAGSGDPRPELATAKAYLAAK